MPGNFCHIEIKVKDLKIAQEFYGKIFGWKAQDMGPNYLGFSTGNSVGGGFELNDKNWPDGPITLYIKVDDIPATLKQIAPAGGKIVKDKTEIGNDFGFYALLRDPFENLIGIWSKT
jgi:predicted enzyme related to lactoylglutathione lyase